MIDEIRGLPGTPSAEIKLFLNGLYTTDCGHDHYTLAAEKTSQELQDELTATVEAIWKHKGMPSKINKVITRHYAKSIWKAVEEGYGQILSKLEYDTPDFNMLSHLQKNVYQFSAAKNYQQLKALTQALLNEEGNLRTKKEFFDAAYTINDEHVKTWLDAERNTAIGSAQMASKWVDITSREETLPLLEFDAVMDGRTSPVCWSLNGVVRPIDDPFWAKYYPPNHWLCRSTVRQRGSSYKVTPANEIVYPEKMQDMFKVNLGKEKLVFPPKHPYWDGLPEDVKKQGYDLMKEDNKPSE